MIELISQQRYREKATPVDIGPYHNHGTPFDTASAAGTVPGRTAVAFPNAGSRVSISPGQKGQWTPLVGLRIEVLAKLDPHAALMLTLLEGHGAFWFGVGQTALEAMFQGPPGSGTYVRSADAFAPDGQMHAVPANRWVTLGFDHDGYSRMQLLIDDRVVGETPVSAGIPPVQSAGVSIGNKVGGGQPLLGIVDEVRVWRLYPKEIAEEFWCRPYTAATAKCWEDLFKAVRSWAAAHPSDLNTLLDLLSVQLRAFIRALHLLPASEQARMRAILNEYLRLWCSGRIDGHEMRNVVDRWVAALRSQGIDPALGVLGSELHTLRQRSGLDPHQLALHCDPKLATFLKHLEQAVAKPGAPTVM
jgi:hypothetical protein